MNCDVCNKTIEDGREIQYPFYGNYRWICRDCNFVLNDAFSARKAKRLEARTTISNLLEANTYDPDVLAELKRVAGMQVSSEEKQAAKAFAKGKYKELKQKVETEYNQQREAERGSLNGGGFVAAGIVFLILGIVLFILSLRKVDGETAKLLGTDTIINIQSTVFCVGSFVCSTICFACKALVSYLKK